MENVSDRYDGTRSYAYEDQKRLSAQQRDARGCVRSLHKRLEMSGAWGFTYYRSRLKGRRNVPVWTWLKGALV